MSFSARWSKEALFGRHSSRMRIGLARIGSAAGLSFAPRRSTVAGDAPQASACRWRLAHPPGARDRGLVMLEAGIAFGGATMSAVAPSWLRGDAFFVLW